MNETQKRIAKYKGMLPHLKEKVAAVAVLLAMSATMLTTVSFAWLALSRSPEATGAHTAIASNGNLEIALATGTMSNWIAPGASQVGDSELVLNERNITWGNLVNLSDPSYGLDNIVLRPARLNKADLLGSPLYGAVYGKDGRIEKLTSNFGFASWVPSDGVTAGYFDISDQLGVRAIASTKLDANVGPYATNYQLKLSAATEANAVAGNAYISITNNQDWMQSLATLMGNYMTVRMDSEQNPTVSNSDIVNLRDMFGAFSEVFEMEAAALAELANFQLYVINGGDETKYVKYTAETLMGKTQAELKAQGIQITNFQGTNTSFVKDYERIHNDYQTLVELAAQGNLPWKDSEGNSELTSLINDLVSVGSCTIQKVNDSNAPMKIDSIGKSAAINYLNQSCNAVITNGLLKRFEERTGEHMKVGQNYNSGKGLKIQAKALGMTGTVYAIISTNAGNDSLFNADLVYGEGLNSGDVGTQVAKDTYGLAIDLWVRTNVSGSYLTLQGNVLTTEEEVQVMGVDATGNEVEIYTVTLTDPEDSAVTYTIDLYTADSQWYYADTHEVFPLEDGQTPNKKKEIIKTVIGYEGENRVWDGTAGLSVNSTTQGSGSCYVYYADTPEDQARSLALLAQLKVAFVDGTGTLLAEAYLDTNNFYAENGKVTVPLVLDPTSCVNLGVDISGNTILAITALEQNVATRISALVYLDGSNLSNEDVLSSSEIQGQMNIQFGSTADLTHAENEELKLSEINISASILEGSSFDYDTVVGDMLTKVAVQIDGEQPKKITAFFLRMVSSTQGSREAPQMKFTFNEAENRWEATHKFTAPGNYILRSVQLDDVEYDLEQENLPTVTINGFSIESLSWKYGNEPATIMTANGSVTEALSVKFATDDPNKMPKSVVGQFVRSSDQSVAAIKFSYDPNSTTWKGDITFASSGEYTLTYLVLDGKHNILPENLQKKITIYLGMKVAVYTDSPIEFLYEGSTMPDNQKNLYMKVKIMDDTNTPMNGRTNVSLRYAMKGSSVVENGMYTELKWNASSGFYEGTFPSKVGMYEFSSVSVGGNIIARDTTSPEFFIISPVPPTFNSGATPEYQYVPAGSASLRVVLNDAEALPYIKATLVKRDKNGELTTYEVDGVPGSDGLWIFNTPEGEIDGYWHIQDIKIAGVYSTDGVLYTEENPLIFDMTDVENVSTKIVSTVNVSFDGQMSKDFNGVFMEEHTVDRVYVILTDFEGQAIQGIKDVQIKLSYDGKSVQYGGYSGAAAMDTLYTLTAESGNTTFAVTNVKLRFAGGYRIADLTYMVDGTSVTCPVADLSNAPRYTVSSTTPTVKITGITQTGTINYDPNNNVNQHTSITVPQFSDTTATVYFKCGAAQAGSGSTCSPVYHNYTRPTVTITLNGFGNASGATLDFGSDVHIYNGTTKTTGYSWTANGNCVRNIGYYQNRTASTDTKTAAGTLTSSTLVLTYDGVNYTVTIPTITINNPD